MSWLSEKLKQIMAKSEPKPPEFPYSETQGLIGEAVAEFIPKSAIVAENVFDINVLIAGKEGLTEFHLKMRIDYRLGVQMMEYPGG